MRAGIIAAGEGLRLQGAFPALPKPMIPVRGLPLAHWTLSALRSAGVESVTLLHNSKGGLLREYLQPLFPDLRWTFLQADTRSSWESFRLVASRCAEGKAPFLVSTVDALVPPAEVARFARTALEGGLDAALALTRFVEDEKPLWAELGSDGRVRALGEAAAKREFVTCGLYLLSPALAAAFPAPGEFSSLREFWGWAVESGRRVLGVPLAKTVDVDRPEDLPAAEALLSSLEAEK